MANFCVQSRKIKIMLFDSTREEAQCLLQAKFNNGHACLAIRDRKVVCLQVKQDTSLLITIAKMVTAGGDG